VKVGKMVKKSTAKKIDNMEISQWVAYTLLYAVGIAVLSGYLYEWFPSDVAYAGPVPVDVRMLVWIVGLSVWGVITTKMFAKFRKN